MISLKDFEPKLLKIDKKSNRRNICVLIMQADILKKKMEINV